MTFHQEQYAADDVCRAQPSRSALPCPRCGYVSAKAPAWADFGVTFALAGARYRIVSVGSTNRHAPRGLHYEDLIIVEPVSKRWAFPETPCWVADVGAALRDLFMSQRFRPHELAAAYLIEAPAS
jgi:hypothetical protein